MSTSLGSKRPELKTSASFQGAAITAKAGEGRLGRDTSPPVKTAACFGVGWRDVGLQREGE